MQKPIVTIEYCPKCGWMLRSTYFAQELLTTFSEELGGVTLKPRKTKGRFPEIKELKQLVRDIACPEKSLGHSDKA
jgi:selenoprotein W-related protein